MAVYRHKYKFFKYIFLLTYGGIPPYNEH